MSCKIATVEADRNQIGIGILYGTAISAAAMRISLRIRSQRRLFLDDAFLVIASAALTAAVPVLYKEIPQLYLIQGVASGGLSSMKVSQLQQSGTVTEAEVHLYQVLRFTYQTLIWTAIFSVKFSFLSFFHQIVDRIQGLVLYWKIVGMMTIVAFAFCVCSSFVECPRTDFVAMYCTYGSGVTRESIIAITATALDLATDILIVSIPVRVLWRVRIRSGQKLGIGVFLSLSVFMIIIACIRIIGFNVFYHAYSWQFFWLQVEGSVAVMMVSLTAFRSVFASQGSGARERKARPWYSSTVAKLRRQKALLKDHNLKDLPSIPSATMSGMRTFIRSSRLGVGPEAYDYWTSYEPSRRMSGQVLVIRDLSWEAEVDQDWPTER